MRRVVELVEGGQSTVQSATFVSRACGVVSVTACSGGSGSGLCVSSGGRCACGLCALGFLSYLATPLRH